VRQIRWTTEASQQFVNAVRHIQKDNLSAAQIVAQAVVDRIEKLATFPSLGRLGEVKGTRELVGPPYVVVYRFTDEIVEILHIWHGTQDWR
jgi:plasmid stabilization system protein ParE